MATTSPNKLSNEQHIALHDDPPALDYEGAEKMIRDWIMEYEGYELFKQILLGNGVTEAELDMMEGPQREDPIAKLGEDRIDAIHTLMESAEDRAYLIVIIKLYQLAVDWAPQQSGHYRHNTIK